MRNKQIIIWGVIVGLFFLAGCGGGGGGSSTPVAPPGTANISVSQSTIDYAGIVLDDKKDQTITVTNTGSSNLNIGHISASGAPFSVYGATDTCSNASLTPYQTCSFAARFSPTSQSTSPVTGTISIPSNDPDSPVLTIHLSGVGYGLNVWINQVDSNCAANPATISANVIVTDPRNNSPLGPLTFDKFQLWHNGVPQTITEAGFKVVYPDSISVVLTLDYSDSLTSAIPDVVAAAEFFIDQFRDIDEAAICKFEDINEFFPASSFTATDASGKASLKIYIGSAFSVKVGTALYDSVYDSVDRAALGTKGKKAVIVLSDGANAPEHIGKTLADVIAHAKSKGVAIFTIFYVDPNFASSAKTEIMQQLASGTGGQYYNPDNTTLTGIFAKISNVLSNKYTITYTPANCAGSGTPVKVRTDYNSLYGLGTKTVDLP